MLDLLVQLRDELNSSRASWAGGGLGIAYTPDDDPPHLDISWRWCIAPCRGAVQLA